MVRETFCPSPQTRRQVSAHGFGGGSQRNASLLEWVVCQLGGPALASLSKPAGETSEDGAAMVKRLNTYTWTMETAALKVK